MGAPIAHKNLTADWSIEILLNCQSWTPGLRIGRERNIIAKADAFRMSHMYVADALALLGTNSGQL